METLAFWVENTDALKEKLSDLPFTPNLAFVFPDISHDIGQIQEIFKGISIFGATSGGEISHDKAYAGGISVLLVNAPQESFKVLFMHEENIDWEELGVNLANKAKGFFDSPSLVISAPGFSDGDAILQGIFSVLPPQAKVIGGFSGDDLSFTKAKIFDNDNIAGSNALVAVAFDSERVIVDGYAANGWRIISDIHTITDSDYNVVYEFDNRPAVDVFLEIYNVTEDKVYELITQLGPRYPVLLYRYNRPPVLRHPISVNLEDKSITFSASMPLLSTVEFGAAPSLEIIDNTIRLIKNNFVNQYEDVDGVILFSCKARQLAFEDDIVKEIEQVYGFWNKPMAGFFTYGEIGIANDKRTDFHNETCNLLILKEK